MQIICHLKFKFIFSTKKYFHVLLTSIFVFNLELYEEDEKSEPMAMRFRALYKCKIQSHVRGLEPYLTDTLIPICARLSILNQYTKIKLDYCSIIYSQFSFCSPIGLRLVFPSEQVETVDETCDFICLVIVLIFYFSFIFTFVFNINLVFCNDFRCFG